MKNVSNEILAVAMGIAAGTALGVLVAKPKDQASAPKSGRSACRNRRRERLLFAKNKLELHRERVNHHLSRINSKIESLGTPEPIQNLV